jgi:hypothetical protein
VLTLHRLPSPLLNRLHPFTVLEMSLHVQAMPLCTPQLGHLLSPTPSRLFRHGGVENRYDIRQRRLLPR